MARMWTLSRLNGEFDGANVEKVNTYHIVSGGFDPIHEGHIKLIKDAASRGDGVIVLLNSDAWLCRKKGQNFMNFTTRMAICENIKNVVAVMEFDDSDNTACDGIRTARKHYPFARLVFANGGDRTKKNVPECDVCKECDVELAFGVGGEVKANSSSWILDLWTHGTAS
jgi:D-beta-D-heptose 7-phosphate kinase/D-beta-D-heptose 1-phosphate adenosyltransferase